MNVIAPIQDLILDIRGQRVMLDRDLAMLYGVETKAQNQAVRRNIDRVPPDFMFTLKTSELQEVVTKCDRFVSLKYTAVTPHAEFKKPYTIEELNRRIDISESNFAAGRFRNIYEKRILLQHTDAKPRADIMW